MKMRTITICAVIGALAAACWSVNPVDRAVNKAFDSAAESAGEQVGKKVGDAVAASILANNPDLLYSYTMSVYGLMFYQGGYHIETEPYEPGQYTAWKSSNVEQADWFEKTLLKRFPNGREWWRVETHQTSSDGEKHVVIMESLFSSADDAGGRKILRMRAQLPGEAQPKEIPVRKNDARTWYFQDHNRLTKESMEGMMVGEETVEVPAGSFETKHLQAAYGSDGHSDWWLTSEVPGGLVKYSRVRSPEAENVYQVSLLEFGDGRTESKLGVDLSQGGGDTDAEAEGDEAPAEDEESAGGEEKEN